MKHDILDGRTRRGLANKKAILEAAKDIFLNSGYLDNTMKDISKKAGVGYGTLYTHFNGKDDILWNLFKEVADDFNKIVYRPYKPSTIEEVKKRQALEIIHLLKLAVRHRQILKITYQAMGHSAMIEKKLDKLFQQYIDKSISDYNYSRKKGLSKKNLEPHIAAKAIVYMVKEFFWDVVLEKEKNLEAISRDITALYLHGAYQ